jgi:excisionase family DNA binding protein
LADAASLLDCSKAHISYLISTGQIKAERVGGRFLLVDPDSVAEYAQNPNRRDRISTTDTRKKRPSLKELADKAMAVAKEAHATTVKEIAAKAKKPRIKVRAGACGL